ncbi:hypothetical protein WH52_06095 [Tenacibaculum holothuriorum]|uniref:N-acetylmuramoyl-L-alanine amidase n=1 Tax=Tenacibaculum holothuriorum TaxID=1635173 RepID=A0A1Y2PDN1_9FLAO|nr:hypothetical protein WH52_06095 [Tenacibaculum holothuriorum]
MNIFSLLLLFVFFSSPTLIFSQKKYTVVLDAGHGGKDPGNLGNGYKEKKIALKVALAVGKELSTVNDINVIYTRKTDVFVELHNRAKIANSNKADLFVSIHCDSYSKERAHGAGTFVLGLRGNSKNLEIAKRENASILYEKDYEKNYDYDPNSPESLIGLSLLQEENLDNSLGIAALIQTNFSSLRRFDRKVKQDNFLVLRETVMPSVLVELGFLTNKAEGRFLNSRSGQLKMAKAIAKAIVKYVKQLKLNFVGTGTIVTTAPVSNNKPIKKVITKKAEPKTVKKTPKKTTVAKNSRAIKVTPKKKPVVKEPTEKGVWFRVQIAAATKKLTSKNFNFRGVKNPEMKRIDGYYKYYSGKSANFQWIKNVLRDTRKLGHKEAFVVAFKDGKKISIKEALKSQ